MTLGSLKQQLEEKDRDMDLLKAAAQAYTPVFETRSRVLDHKIFKMRGDADPGEGNGATAGRGSAPAALKRQKVVRLRDRVTPARVDERQSSDDGDGKASPGSDTTTATFKRQASRQRSRRTLGTTTSQDVFTAAPDLPQGQVLLNLCLEQM